ncbi:6-phosphogluconolactonase, cycloisomerase 2 family [Spirosomataceae bacterium TFI 002]|nr:6-phosphogluconolactonase, cycloisomerase 2 family [Spirosomataceae bacterium TFI 002]
MKKKLLNTITLFIFSLSILLHTDAFSQTPLPTATFESSYITHAFREIIKDRTGTGGINNLEGATGVSVSPDGKNIYVVSYFDDALTVFDRDLLTGGLSFKEDFQDGNGGVNNIARATGVSVSPDGKNVYVVSFVDAALTVFDRDVLTGGLMFKEDFIDGNAGVNNLDDASGVSVSPDGKQVYVVSQLDDALTVFDRDVLTGGLTFKEDFIDGNGLVHNLDGATGVSVSPDGKQVYVVSILDDALTVFDRDAATGRLTFKEDFKDGNAGVINLDGAAGVSVSLDGKQVYVVSEVDGALTVFDRDVSTGGLTFKQDIKDGNPLVNNLRGATYVSVSPDGKNVYVVSRLDDALTVFDRDAVTGDLTFKQDFNGENNLAGARGVSVSPDNKQVYVVGRFGNALTVFDRQAPPIAFATATNATCEAGTSTAGDDGKITIYNFVTGDRFQYSTGTTFNAATASAIMDIPTDGIIVNDLPNATQSYTVRISNTNGCSIDRVVYLFESSCCINHAFLEDFKDGTRGVNNLNGATGVAVSPDGKQVYVVSSSDHALTVFDRDAGTGLLSFKQDFKDGTGEVNNLNAAVGVSVSPDGKNVYVVSFFDDALTVFDRDLVTGGLMFKEDFKDGIGEVKNLDGAQGVAVSPDGKQVYVVSGLDDALTVFNRNVLTGELSFKQDFKDNTRGANNLDGAFGVSVSPDGKQVYVVAQTDDALTIFDRDAVTGDLSFKQDFKDEVDGVNNLEGARGVSVSPDGKQVYVVSANDDALTVFDRDAGSGELSFKEDFIDGTDGVNNLNGAVVVSVSQDGKRVYLVSFIDGALTVFERNAGTGDLTFKEDFKDGIGEVKNLDGAQGVAVSPDGKNVYVVSFGDDALTVFDRQAPPIAFATTTNASCEAGTSTANDDGKITIYNFSAGDRFQYSTGTTFNAATASAIMDIPTDGVIVNDLPNETQSYTVRISNANVCSIDRVVYLFESNCCINHAFQEDFIDGTGGVNNLDGATGVAVSPDGKNVYVASVNDDALTVFDRNVLTGGLSFKQDFKDGTGEVNNLNGARGLAVSPDGKQVYVVSSIDASLTVFDRDGLTGALSFKQDFKDAVGRVNNLRGAGGVAVSPDGKQVYVVSYTDDALTVFDRDVLTGDLRFKEDFIDETRGANNLNGAIGVSVSPDGKQVYVVSELDHALTVFDRNVLTGGLSFKQDFKDGSGEVNNLNGAGSVVVSPDGKQVYVVSVNDDALTVFDRDVGTGVLTFKEDFIDGIGEVKNLNGLRSVAVSQDGKQVYVVSANDASLTVFERDAGTGDLTFKEDFKDGTGDVNNLNSARGVVVSPDGKNVYVVSLVDDALTVFDRQASANAGTPTNIAVCDNVTTAINLFEQLAGEDAGGTWSRKSGTGGTFVAETGMFTPEKGASTSTFSYTVSGCPDATADVVVTVNPSSFTSGTAVNPTTCGGTDGSITFTTALADGTYSLSFTTTGTTSPQDVTVSSGAFTLNGLSAGAYSNFSITYAGCAGTDLSNQVLSDPPTPVVSASFVSPFCQGSSLELTSSVSGTTATAVYDWSGPGGFSSSDPNPVVTSPIDGIYTLTVTAAGCTSSAVTPSISPIPPFSLTNRIPSAFNDIYGCENALTVIGLDIENADEYTYQWQQSTRGAFADLSESSPYSQVTNDTLEINPTSLSMDGYQYRALISNGCETVISDTFNLKVGATPMIMLQPVSQIVCPTSEAILEVDVNGAGVSFQWQIDNGSGFVNVSGSEYFGANSKKLIISNFDYGKSGKAFRCLVFTSCFQIPSDPATITINTDVTILAQPMSQTVCEFGTAIFTAQAVKLSAGTLTYQWQRKSGIGVWTNINTGGRYTVNGNQLSIANAPASWDGAEFRCLMNDYCQTIPKTLNVIPVAHVTQNPVNQEICVGNNAGFSITAAGEGLTYRWQVNSGSGFVNLTDGGIYQGATSANLSLSFPSVTVNNYQYRCVVSGTSTCDLVADTSAVASISVGVSAEAQTVFYNSPISNDDGVTQAVGYILGINDILAPNGKAEFRAGNSIQLMPGFEAQAGAVFTAKIQNPCQVVSTSFDVGGSKIPKEKVK